MADVFLGTYEQLCSEYNLPLRPGVVQMLKDLSATSAASGNSNLQLLLNGNCIANFRQRLTDVELFPLIESLEVSDCFVRIDLSYNQLTDAGASALARFIKNSKRLRSLSLRSNNIGGEGAAYIAGALRGNSIISELDLSHNPLGDQGGIAIANAVGDHQSLRALSLDNCDLGTTSMIALAIALRSNRTLQRASLARPLKLSKDAEVAVHLADAVAATHSFSLKELCLAKHQMGDEAFGILCKGLERNTSITSLDVCGNSLSADSGVHLAKLLRVNVTLRHIRLHGNRLCNQGAAALVHVLRELGSSCVLASLDLGSNSVGDAGLSMLLSAISPHPSDASDHNHSHIHSHSHSHNSEQHAVGAPELKELRLWNNEFGPTSGVCAKRLRELRPDLSTDFIAYDVDGQSLVAHRPLEEGAD